MSSYEQLLPPPESVAVALGSRVSERCKISLLRPRSSNETHSPTHLVVGNIRRGPTCSPELNCQPNRTPVAIAMIAVE